MEYFLAMSISSLFAELNRRHQLLEARVVGGYSPAIAPLSASQGNYVVQGDRRLSTSGSISDSEMFIFYGVCEILKPRRILVVGNSYGLSAAFFGLTNPDAEIVALDKYRIRGLEFTRQLCQGLQVTAIEASTPSDLASTIHRHFDGLVDLVFIDAVHESEVQTAEFRILAPLLSDRGVVLFHDVLTCGLLDSISQLSNEFPNFNFRVLAKSLSGVGVAYDGSNMTLTDYLNYFEASPQHVAQTEATLRARVRPSTLEFFKGVDLGRTFHDAPHPQI